MPPHPLDLPEILALVGTFLPIWEGIHPSKPSSSSFLFKPAPLSRCLLVSKFWHDTLLPILWYGFWSNDSVASIPSDALARHTHLLKVLQIDVYNFADLNWSLLGCTHLVELDITVDKHRAVSKEAEIMTENQLLQLNPSIKKLRWTGYACKKLLSSDDFVGLKNLESLTLEHWDCSLRHLARTLKPVSGTLRRLKVESFEGLKPESISTALLQDGDRCGMDTRADNAEQEGGLRLERLEWLKWTCGWTSLGCFIEFVKCCPNLKALELISSGEDLDLDRLPESLRTHCPHLDSLSIGLFARSPTCKTFLHRCSTSGLRYLDVGSNMPQDDLISGILHHASTLEDLQVHRSGEDMNGSALLQLLVDCTKLRRISFQSNFKTDPLKALMQDKWQCRGLRELALKFNIRNGVTEANIHEFQRMAFDAGWALEPAPFTKRSALFLTKGSALFDADHLPKVFELLEFQELKELQTFTLSRTCFRRIRHQS